jgi:hypothetical protein
MSTLCNQCESFNVNGIRTHERGCQNGGKQIYLGDDGTLDTVIYCGKCKAEERYNFDPTSIDCEDCNDSDVACESHYDDFVEDSLREFQDEHECFECNECGSFHETSDDAYACCPADWEEIGNNAEENKEIADSLISEVYDTSNHLVTCDYPSLWVRTIETENRSPEAQKALEQALASFEGKFSFEAKQIFVNNIYAYEIELPRIIYNF